MMFGLPTKRIFGILFVTTFLLLASIASVFTVSMVRAASQTISPTDPNIKYVGRWDTSSSTVYTSYWPGAYFETQFTGTTVAIQLANPVKIYVTIDNGADTLYSGANKTVNLTPKPLAAGTHWLRVATPNDTNSIALQGLVLDAGAITVAPTLSSKLVEFTGDSITTGMTNSKEILSSYAWLTGERLGVQHTQVSQIGICLVDNIQCYSPNAIGMSRQFFKLQTTYYPNSPNWDFTRHQASAVVINLGGCDQVFTSAATFQSSYETFLRHLRQVYPEARIFALRSFIGRNVAATQAAVQAVGDKNVQDVDTNGWLNSSDYNDGMHPSDAGHAKIASLLAPIIKAYLDRDSTVPSASSYAMNAGGSKAGSFVTDAYYSGGKTYVTRASINTSGVSNPAPQAVYQAERYGNFTYSVPGLTAGRTYTVRLHFAEIYWTSSGRRLFNVAINGQQVLTNFDIYATAKAANKAIVRPFTATADANGQITIRFTTVKDNAKVSGIEILAN